MANRPVYAVGMERNLCQVHGVEFTWHKGLAKIQRLRNSLSLREAFLERKPGLNVLEVSRFSDSPLGEKLSAFNLMITTKEGKKMPVECAYQGSKIIKGYGHLSDLYDVTAMEAKKDPRHSGSQLLGFAFDGEEFGLHPRSGFYNWLYIRALAENQELADQLMEYDAFTDIAFNPEKSSSCQAEACAYYVALRRYGLLEDAMESKEKFVEIVYRVTSSDAPVMGGVYRARDERAAGTGAAASGAAVKAESPKPMVVINVGDVVKHPKFGDGVVIAVSEDKDPEILTIQFAVGEKKIAKEWLAAAMAKK